MSVSNADIKAWFEAESDQRHGPDLFLDTLIIRYVDDDLSAADRRRVNELREVFPAFDARTKQLTRMLKLPAGADQCERAEARRELSRIFAQLEHEVRWVERLKSVERRLYPRRSARAPWLSRPTDPSEFVESLVAELGTDSVQELVNAAEVIVSITGEPDPWIVEVGRARSRGAISVALAHFLIWDFAVAAMKQLVTTHHVLSRLNAHMEDIEREHGFVKGAVLLTYESPPPGLQELYDEFNVAFEEQVMDIFLRNGEREIAKAYATDDHSSYELGYSEISEVEKSKDVRRSHATRRSP